MAYKKNIALVTGGDSGESVISLQSAKIISANIDKEKFDVYTVMIKGSSWKYIAADGSETAVDKNDFSVTEKGKKVLFDAVFLAIHGTPGEDGKLQGYFDVMGIPYTFSGVISSSITFSKSYSHELAKLYGATVATSVLLKGGEKYNVDDILKVTGLPCFVKPNNGGSSIGITKVKDKKDMDAAIAIALKEDAEVQIEEFIEGPEVTCGILQKGKELIALPMTEIVPKREFFDYIAKYTDGMSDEITPARISEEMREKCCTLSLHLFRKFNCKGVARFDYIIKNNVPYFLEVNTIPGLSAASIVPKQAEAMGIPLKELFSILIENVI
jgi:D-alanine-D-alanine ligase